MEDETSAPVELLNSRRPGGFPDHNLVLKVGCPVILLRNLSSGMVNGTRMLVKGLHDKVVECEVFVGEMKGERVFIPRIPMVDKSGEFPWDMTRVQFPLRVCFAMTFHKVGKFYSIIFFHCTKIHILGPRTVSEQSGSVHKQAHLHSWHTVHWSQQVRLGKNLKIFVSDNSNKTRKIVFYEML